MKRFLLIVFLLLCACSPALAWDFSQHSIPLSEILSGGPPKAGIPALTDPKFLPASWAMYLRADDRVLGLFLNGEAKAYPVKVLNWHESVNDVAGSSFVVVTYCPLTGTGLAFHAEDTSGERLLFGVSGKLYNSNVLLYDRVTESLWSQLKMQAVTGKMTGTALKPVPLLNTTWRDWRKLHRDTKVLSQDTGHRRNYDRDPYGAYESTSKLFFPVSNTSKALHAKALVLGVVHKGQGKAYPFRRLALVPSPVRDEVGGEAVLIHFDKRAQSARATSANEEVIQSVQAYWFAWFAFHPDTELFAPKR